MGASRFRGLAFPALSVALFSRYFALNYAAFALSPHTCFLTAEERSWTESGFSGTRERDPPFARNGESG